MSKFTIQLKDDGQCQIQHGLADVVVMTDTPPEYGGKGRSFSSTDLVSAALGSCILSTIDKIIERAGYDPTLLKIDVTKTLSQKPKMIAAIDLAIFYPDKLDNVLLQKLERATATCPVKRSLNPAINLNIIFITGANAK